MNILYKESKSSKKSFTGAGGGGQGLEQVIFFYKETGRGEGAGVSELFLL